MIHRGNPVVGPNFSRSLTNLEPSKMSGSDDSDSTVINSDLDTVICIFCNEAVSDDTASTVYTKGLKTLITVSKERKDGLHKLFKKTRLNLWFI